MACGPRRAGTAPDSVARPAQPVGSNRSYAGQDHRRRRHWWQGESAAGPVASWKPSETENVPERVLDCSQVAGGERAEDGPERGTFYSLDDTFCHRCPRQPGGGPVEKKVVPKPLSARSRRQGTMSASARLSCRASTLMITAGRRFTPESSEKRMLTRTMLPRTKLVEDGVFVVVPDFSEDGILARIEDRARTQWPGV